MNCRSHSTFLLLIAASIVLGACSTTPRRDLNLEQLNADFQAARSDDRIAEYAPSELQTAEEAMRQLRAAPTVDDERRAHLAYIAERRLDIARARASERFEKAELISLQRERDQILLQASLRDAEAARAEADALRRQNVFRTEEADRARREAAAAREQSERDARERDLARREAEQARRVAEAQAREADLARQEAELASAAVDSMRRQLQNLQARETSRGLMFTLGDVLFEYGEANLREESLSNLGRLISFIQQYPDQTVSIEGHTDSVGSEDFNLRLSQQRADAVRDALIDRGIAPQRLQSVGLGEEFPIADNATDLGKRQNRRVEIIILNAGQEGGQ